MHCCHVITFATAGSLVIIIMIIINTVS